MPPPDPPDPVKPREPTPGIKKKSSRRSKSQGSDRGSDYETDVESPAVVRGRRRQRHKSNRVRTVEDDLMMGGKPSHSGTPPSWGLPQKDLPPLKLFRVREISPPRVVLGDDLDRVAELFEGLDYGWGYDGISALFDGLSYNKMSHFQRKVHKVMKVFRIHGGQRDPLMKGRILGSSTNKYLNFIADTGSPIAIIPKGVAVKNNLSIMPTDEDEP